MTKLPLPPIDAVLRVDFQAFMEFAWPIVSGSPINLDAPYLSYAAALIQSAIDGDQPRLALHAAPRHGKSILVSVILPAFLLVRDSTAKVLCVTHDEKLGETHHNDTRKLLEHPRIKKLTPGLKLRKDTSDAIVTTKGGFRKAFTMAGNITGHGGDFLIIDDPINAKNASSETLLDQANEQIRYLITRLDQPKEARAILAMQRLRINDAGDLAKEMGWTSVSLPLVAPFDEEWQVGSFKYLRKKGEYLDPGRIGPEEEAALRRELGSAAFEAQYQQNPLPAGGGYVKWHWFKTYTTLPPLEAIFQSWDVATIEKGGNYSVCTTWGYAAGKFYLIDIWRRQITSPDLLKAIKALDQKYQPNLIVIEGNGVGGPIVQFARADGLDHVWPSIPSKSKKDRFESIAPIIERGEVYLPASATWLKSFHDEVLAFPEGKYDDQADSMSQFLNEIGNIFRLAHIEAPPQYAQTLEVRIYPLNLRFG
jgi:predicted phage terminase large subunit-like protein